MQWLAERWGLARIIMMTGFDPRYAKVAEHVGTSEMVSGITTPLKPISVARLTSLGTNGAAIRNNRERRICIRRRSSDWTIGTIGIRKTYVEASLVGERSSSSIEASRSMRESGTNHSPATAKKISADMTGAMNATGIESM